MSWRFHFRSIKARLVFWFLFVSLLPLVITVTIICFYAPNQGVLFDFVVLMALVFAVVIGIALFLAGTLARPTLELAEVAKKIQQGDLSARNPLGRVDELGLLAQAFNEMADSLASRVAIHEKLMEELRRQSAELSRRNLELLEQKSRIEAADRMKSTFIATMSHELRTPLNSIIALSRVLITQAKKRLTPDEAGYLSIVERNGSRLLALVNDILDLSRIESGKVDLTVWPFSPAQMIETLCKSLEPLAREKGLKIIQEIPRDLPDLHSDERYVHRILQNILMNAIKFTDKGMISLTARSEGGSLLVKVCDTGIGIRSEELQRIFDEFVRGDASASSPYEGSGLGLAIAAKSARLLGGEIRVESRPDEGSEFTLILPLRIQENPEDTAEEESALPQKSAGERE